MTLLYSQIRKRAFQAQKSFSELKMTFKLDKEFFSARQIQIKKLNLIKKYSNHKKNNLSAQNKKKLESRKTKKSFKKFLNWRKLYILQKKVSRS